jgi:hypothetical protein
MSDIKYTFDNSLHKNSGQLQIGKVNVTVIVGVEHQTNNIIVIPKSENGAAQRQAIADAIDKRASELESQLDPLMEKVSVK